MTASSPSPERVCGFSLIELAVVIFIVGLLLGSIFLPLQSRVESGRITDTQKILDNAREALIGYAAGSGRFPCPASVTSNGGEHLLIAGTGVCHTSVTGAAGTNVYVGYLPAATLGFTPTDANGYALDAWGLSPQNRILYAVSYQTVVVARPFTTPPTSTAGMRGAGMLNILNAGLLNVCNTAAGSTSTSCAAGTALTSNAIVVIWSRGGNAATSGGASADEAENYEAAFTSADRVFVSKTRVAAGEAGGEFDDIVTWIAPPTLFNRLIAAGQLP